MPKKDNNKTFEYEGSDLEAMMVADNYYRWIFSDIKPYLGNNIVEVGSGIGSFSKMILKTKPQNLHLIEPSKNTFGQLKEITKLKTDTKINVYNGYLEDFSKEIKQSQPDTFIYINVFEHIENDNVEMNKITSLLKKNGHIIIFVPALQGLYSNFDKSIGHYRRYTKRSLRKLCEDAGLEVVSLDYRDIIGVASWWVSFVILKSTKLSPSLVKIYDKYFINIIRAIESRVKVPIGKNLLIVAKKQ